MTMLYALLVLCFSGSALAQSSGRGRCPRVTIQPNLDLDRFVGRWYEAERHFHNFEYPSKCNVIDYTFGTNSALHVLNSFIDKISGKPGSVQADIHVPNKKVAAKMLIHMPLTPPGTISNYWILGTDYNSYMVIWGCTEFEELNMTYAWILTKKRNPPQSVMEKAYRVLNRNKLDRSKFFKVDQKSCRNNDDDDDDDDDDCSDEK